MAGERPVMMIQDEWIETLKEISLIALSFFFLSGRPDSLVGGRSFHVLPRVDSVCFLLVMLLSAALLLPLVSYALRSKSLGFENFLTLNL